MVAYRQGQFAFRTTGDSDYAKEGYAGNSDVYACIDAIATAAKGIDWILYKARDERAKQRASVVLKAARSPRQYRRAFGRLVKQRVLVPVDGAHPLLELMASPNPFMDWTDLVEAIVGFYCISGNTFLHMVGPDEPSEEAKRPPMEIWPLRPDRTKIKVGDSVNPIECYKHGRPGAETTIHPSQVVHFRKFNPLDDFYGMSPLQAAARRIDQMSATEEWNYQLTQNMAVPPGVFRSEVPMDEDQEEELEAHHRTKYLGPKNAGQPIITHGGDLEWTAMGLSPAEMHWIEGEKAGTRKICSVLGVAPELIGDSANKTFSNYGEARKALYQETVLPILDMIVSKLNAGLVPRFGDDLFLAYDPDDIEALQEDRDKVWARVKDADFLTINDKRAEVGKEPVDGGDVILVPAMMIPLQALSYGGTGEEGEGAAKHGGGPQVAKAINLRSYDHKTEWWKAVERQREGMVEVVERLTARTFRSELKAVKEAIDASTDPIAATLRAQRAIDAHETVWTDWIRTAYLTVAEVFARNVVDSLEKQAPGRMESKAVVEDVWQATVLEHLGKVAAKKVQGITNTTRLQVRSALAEGVMEGEGIDKLAKRVDALYLTQIIPYRSTVIARTETIAASNLGSRAGAEATGLPLEKEWIATRGDGRTREAHEDADGLRTPMDDPYEVDGEALMFPGDDSLGASAGNTIQCRCTEGYHVVGVDG